MIETLVVAVLLLMAAPGMLAAGIGSAMSMRSVMGEAKEFERERRRAERHFRNTLAARKAEAHDADLS